MITFNTFTKKLLIFLLYLPFMAYAGVVFFGIKDPVYLLRIAIIIIGLGYIIYNFQNIKIPLFSYLLLLFVVYEYIWSFYSGVAKGRFLNLSYIYNSKHFAFFIISTIIYNTNFSQVFILKTIRILKITIILAAIVTVIQLFYPRFLNANIYIDNTFDILIQSDIYNNRRASIFGFIDRNSMGLDFLPLLSLLVSFLFVNKSKLVNVFIIIGALISIGSNARYVMIGFFILLLQLLIIRREKIAGLFRFISGVILIILFLTFVSKQIGWDLDRWISERIFVEDSIEESERFKAYFTFIRFFPENPWFGTGAFTEEVEQASLDDGSSNIHMGYLRLLVINGIFGCILLYGSWILLARRFIKTAKVSGFWGSFFSLLVFLWAFATFYESSLFFYGILFACVFDKYYSDKYRLNISKHKLIHD